jgi:hypothetical protein
LRIREYGNESFLIVLKPAACSLMPVFYHHLRNMAKTSACAHSPCRCGPLTAKKSKNVAKAMRAESRHQGSPRPSAPIFPSFLSAPRGIGCKDFRQSASRTLPFKSRRAGLSRFLPRPLYTMPAVSLYPERVVAKAYTSKGTSSAVLRVRGWKRSPGEGLAAYKSRKGHVSCISTQQFSREQVKKNLTPPKKFYLKC